MSRKHAGQYSKKHPSDTTVAHAVMEAVSSKMAHQKIACKAAFEIASNLSVLPSIVGTAIDLQEGRIISCQLGLFGYGKAENKLRAAAQVRQEIEVAINASLIERQLSCEKVWQIADTLIMPRIKIAQACEAFGVKICSCQLGAF